MKKVTPNQLKQVQQELATFDLGNFEIPTEIQEREAALYVCIGVKSTMASNKKSINHTAKVVFSPLKQWNTMARLQKHGQLKNPYGIFDHVFILHNPTIKPKKEVNKIKGLSPKQKGQVNDMLAESKDAKAIAAELNIDLDRVQAYIATIA